MARNNDVRDNYYRHIYPVAELQYGAIKQIYDEFGAVTESQIMDVINAIEYKPDNWNPWYFRRTFEVWAILELMMLTIILMYIIVGRT